MKRALVLSGGGSRGAYECGAWQALTELGIHFDAAYGTSIGAIGAALVAQGDVDTAAALWDSVTLDNVFGLDTGTGLSIEHMMRHKLDIIPLLTGGNIKSIRLDIAPLEKLLRGCIDENRVRASGMEVGFMLTRVPSMTAREARLRDIPRGLLHDYMIASASCFPAFPIRKIGEDRYIDGGYSDNMPIAMALADGAGEIVGVDIHPQPTHPEYENMPFLRSIRPLRDLGNFLDFKRERLRKNRRLGYNDTMKAYGRYDGIRYTFRHIGERQVADAARAYAFRITEFDARRDGDAPLMRALCVESGDRKLGWKEFLLRGLELCAALSGISEDSVYDPPVLTAQILAHARAGGDVDTSDRGLADAMRGDGFARLQYLYRALRADSGFAAAHEKRLSDAAEETAAAMYLITIENIIA